MHLGSIPHGSLEECWLSLKHFDYSPGGKNGCGGLSKHFLNDVCFKKAESVLALQTTPATSSSKSISWSFSPMAISRPWVAWTSASTMAVVIEASSFMMWSSLMGRRRCYSCWALSLSVPNSNWLQGIANTHTCRRSCQASLLLDALTNFSRMSRTTISIVSDIRPGIHTKLFLAMFACLF